jgi:hypothetical protein
MVVCPKQAGELRILDSEVELENQRHGHRGLGTDNGAPSCSQAEKQTGTTTHPAHSHAHPAGRHRETAQWLE